MSSFIFLNIFSCGKAIGRAMGGFALTCFVASGLEANVKADNRILDRLEAGEVISAKLGGSVLLQSITSQDPEKVRKAFTTNFSGLSDLFSEIAFARPFITDAGRRLVYLKLKGMGDGLSVLVEVKQGANEAFNDAKSLMDSAKIWKSGASSSEASLTAAETTLKSEVADANKVPGVSRTFMPGATIVLEGPLNEVMELPGVRFTVTLSTASYMVSPTASATVPLLPMPAAKTYTYLAARIAVAAQVTDEHLPDYRGFGDRRLGIMERLGVDLFSALQKNLQKL